jgi:hypothetical protein
LFLDRALDAIGAIPYWVTFPVHRAARLPEGGSMLVTVPAAAVGRDVVAEERIAGAKAM